MRLPSAALAVLLGALLAGPAAEAHMSAIVTYRVVGATHASSARKSDPPFYTGSSTSTWRLAPPGKNAANTLGITDAGSFVTGLGSVNVRGVFKARAKTNLDRGDCSLSAPTGTTKYPAVAPGAFQLAVSLNPKSPGRLLFVQGLGANVHASLSNPYFGTECSTSVSGQPDSDELMVKSIPRNTFTKKLVVIRFTGSTNRDGIAYRWSTTFTLKRIGS